VGNLFEATAWRGVTGVGRATTKSGGGQRRKVRRSLGLGQEDLGPKMSTGRMVELGAQFIGAM
jgi:hypothetical protein